MNHNRIVRGLVMILVIVLVVICIIMACPPVRAAECRLEGMPQPTPWEPDEADVVALAQTLYGECRGCSELQQRAVCWCIFNRVDDSRFPDTVVGVIVAPYQFFGYSPSNPIWDSLSDVAYSCLVDWHNGENRVLDDDLCFFSGNGRTNTFRNAWDLEFATKFWGEE